jgi:hypothetical protein
MRHINFQLDIPIGPEWSDVELLRTSILNCLTTIFHNHDFSQTVGIVTGELLENAIKYGYWDAPDQSSFKLKVSGTDSQVQVEVSNPVPPDDDHPRNALRSLDWIRQFPTPRDAYHARLREVAANISEEAISRLGLVRIAYEGNCQLEGSLDGGVLRICAISRPDTEVAA